MEMMTATATDRRIDELAKNVEHRFDRVEGDLREFRTDIRDLRAEMKSGNDALRTEMKAGDDALRAEIAATRSEARAGEDSLRAEIGSLSSQMQTGEKNLRAEMKSGDDALRLEMREGFAAVNASIARLSTVVEGTQKMLLYVLAGIVSTAIAGVIVAVLTARL